MKIVSKRALSENTLLTTKVRKRINLSIVYVLFIEKLNWQILEILALNIYCYKYASLKQQN